MRAAWPYTAAAAASRRRRLALYRIMHAALPLTQAMAGKQLYDAAFAQALGAVERGLVPDAVVRAGIRWLLTQRKREVRWCCFASAVFCIGQAVRCARSRRRACALSPGDC